MQAVHEVADLTGHLGTPEKPDDLRENGEALLVRGRFLPLPFVIEAKLLPYFVVAREIEQWI
jgi:hypothetical protein